MRRETSPKAAPKTVVSPGVEDRSTSIQVGQAAEALAAQYLKEQGFRILHLNWRCRKGEIDIVADEGGTLVFVEVKSRERTRHGSPGEAVTWRKQCCIANAAALYAVQHHLEDSAMRFDVVEVLQDHGTNANSFRLWRSAFTPSGSYLAL